MMPYLKYYSLCFIFFASIAHCFSQNDSLYTDFTTAAKNVANVYRLKIRCPNNQAHLDSLRLFSNLRELEITLASTSELDSLPKAILALSKLEYLDLSGHHLSKLPPEISVLTQLKHLDLSANNFSEFPKVLSKLPSLQYLSFSSNKIYAIPVEIAGLKSLETLVLRRNKINNMTDSICLLKSLKVLDLSLNELKELPHSIGQLSKLETLDCSFNFLWYLPMSISTLPKAKKLDFRYNELRYHPDPYPDSIGKNPFILLGNPFTVDRVRKQQKIAQSLRAEIDPRDGKIYNSVLINEQRWMLTNLDFVSEQSSIDSTVSRNFGRLYHYSDVDKVCPDGWHSATQKDWRNLMAEVIQEFPFDEEEDLHEETKRTRQPLYSYREDPLIMFDPYDPTHTTYHAMPYLSYPSRKGLMNSYNNFYYLNIPLPEKPGRYTALWAGKLSDNEVSLMVFDGQLDTVKNMHFAIKKIKDAYYVRCVED